MADVRTALVDFLRTPDDRTREALAGAVGDSDGAQLRRAAAEAPGSPEAAAALLGRLLIDKAPQSEFLDTAKLLAQRVPRDGSGTEVALLAGMAVWQVGGQAALAEPYFRRVRRTMPASPEVLAFYRELFSDAAGASQLMQILVQARRGTQDPEQRFVLAEEMAELAETRLSSLDRAVEVWRSVLREDGHDPRAIRALERLYRAAEKWTALVELLKDEFDRIPSVPDRQDERIATLLEIAELYSKRLNLDAMALATFQRVLEIDPRHENSLNALAETYTRAGRWNDLLGVYQRRIDAAQATGDREAQVGLLRKVGQVWIEQLGNPQRALEPLQGLLALEPRDTDARKLVASIHEQRRDWRALIALRRDELPALEDAQALELRIDLARLAEDRLGDRREAVAAWNEVLEHHGDVPLALDALSRLYERESRWPAAAEILRRKLATIHDRQFAMGLLAQLGSIYSDRLRSREDALPIWQELARVAPGHDKATRMLRDTYVATGAWDELTALYESQDRIGDLVDVLQSAADRVSEIEDRVALYRRVAELCQDRLGQPERAVKALERTLAIQPDNLAVARELLPIYREQSNWARLMSTYEVLVRAASEDDERLELIAATRDVAEYKLGSASLTLHWAARAYEIRPTDSALRSGLEQAAEAADGWDELTRIYEQRASREDIDSAERLLLLETLAIVARDRLFKPDDAQRYFRRIVTLQPTNAQAMAALEDIYSSMRRWDDLSEVYRKRLEVTDDPQSRLQTLRGLAKLQEEQLGDLDSAVESLSRVLELEPDDRTALASIARVYRQKGQWDLLAQVLQRLIDLTPDDDARVPLMFELAHAHATHLDQVEAAVDEFMSVLEIEPLHRPTVDALESLVGRQPATTLAIMRGLLPYYRRVGTKAKEAQALEIIVDAEPDEQVRLDQLQQLATLYEKLPDRAADALRIRSALLRSKPAEWENRQALKRLGHALGDAGTVASAYRAVLAQFATQGEAAEEEGRALSREDALLRRDLLLELAAIERDDLGHPDTAEQAYREVLEQDETHQGAYEALEQLLIARAASEELVRLYRRRVDVVFNQREQKQLLSRIVELSRNVLGDRPTAVSTAEELLDLVPDDVPTIELLAQMYNEGTELRDKQQLEELLGRWAELVDDDARQHQLVCWRAALRIQYLSDAFGAVDLVGQVLGEAPDNPEAKRLLEDLLDIDEVQSQVCSLLEPIYIKQGEHEGRIRVLQVRRAHALAQGALDQAIAHLLEIARIEEIELGSPDTAFDTVRSAYLLDARRQDTREELQRLGLGLAREAELVAIWREALASDVADRPLQIDLTHRIARLLDERVDDFVGARAAYIELLDLDPPDASVARRAVLALCRLHQEAGDTLALVQAKRALLQYTDSAVDQIGIHLDIAEIQEQELYSRVDAAMSYSEVLDMQPDNGRALDALERLFREEQEWLRLCELLHHRISVTSDSRGRAALWRQIGEIQRDALGDSQLAIEAFQSILDLKVGRDETVNALQALVTLQRDLERWPDVEEGLRRLVALASADEARVELLVQTAEVVGHKIGRADDALDLLKRVLDLAPTEPRARALVAEYLDHEESLERAIRILTPVFEKEQNWPALLKLEELQARHQPSGRRRLQALLRVARTHEERLGAPQAAFEVLCSAMAEAVDQPELSDVIDKLERLGSHADRSETLLRTFATNVDSVLESSAQQRILRLMGKVALDRLGELEKARDAYEAVLELAPDDREATGALEEIYLRQKDNEALAALLAQRAERMEPGPQRDDCLIRAAELHRTELDRPEDAIQLYERLGNDGLARPNVQSVLEPLYEITGRYRELATHLNRKLSRLQGKLLVDTHLRLGRLYGQQLDDPEEGIRHLGMALRLDPDHAVATEDLNRYLEDESMRAKAAEMLEPVFAAVQDWPRLIQIQEIRLAENPEDHALRGQILLRVAQLEEEQLEDLDRAFDSYVRLFKEQPRHRYVRDQLARLAGVLQKTEVYAELLTSYVNEDALGDDSDEVLEIVREAADLWVRSLRRPAAAVPLYERLVVARPEHSESVFPALEQALSQSEMWRELIDAYWRESESSMDEPRRIELLRRLATVASDLLDDPEEAARAFQRILEIRPDHDPARRSLERIYETHQRYQELLDLLRDRLDRVSSSHERAGIYLRLAEIQRGPLEEADAAIDTLESLLAELPAHLDAIGVLERIAEQQPLLRPRVISVLKPHYESAGDGRKLLQVAQWQLEFTQDPLARHELFQTMAALSEDRLQDPEGAFRTLCRALAEPGPDTAIARLDEALQRLAERLHDPAALARALVAAAGADEMDTDVDRRLVMLVRAAGIQLAQQDSEGAVKTLQEALSLNDDHAPALALLDAALVQRGEHQPLSDVLRRRILVAFEDDERVALMRRLATLLEDHLNQPQEAEQVWRDLLDLAPEDREALARLSRSYEASGSVDELIEMLRRRVEASQDDGERRELRSRLATILREQAKDRTAEIDVLRDLLAEHPSDDEALAALAQALLAEERHGEAAEAIQERANLVAAPERKAELLLSAARIHVDPLEDVMAALERYRDVLALVPGQAGALSDLLRLTERPDSSDAATAMVLPELEQVGRYSDLAALYEARAKLVLDPEERVRALMALARVRGEQLDDPRGSLAVRRQLLGLLPADQLAKPLVEAGRLAVALEDVDAHVTALAHEAQVVEREPRARLLLARSGAELAEEIMGDRQRAIDVLRPLLEGGLADVGLCEHIERLARHTGELGLAAEALRERSRLADGPSAQAEALVRLGETLDQTGKTPEAVEAFRDALDVHPGHGGAMVGLERLVERAAADGSAPAAALDALEAAYHANDSKVGLAKVARLRLASASEVERPRWLESLATLLSEGGGEPEEAMEVWGELLTLDPHNAHALERLLVLGRENDLAGKAADALLRALEGARAAGQSATAVALAAVSVLLDDLRDGARALRAIEHVLDEQPENPEALALLVRAARSTGDAQALHGALVRTAQVQNDPEEAVSLWREAASVAETQLGKPDLAIEDLERLIDEDEEAADAWEKLLTLLRDSEHVQRLATALERRILISPELDERLQLRQELAKLLVGPLGRPEEAVSVYNDMLADKPDDVGIMAGLQALLERLGRWEDVREVLARKLDVVDESGRVALLEEWARLAETRLEDTGDAIERWQQVLQLRPGHPGADPALERLLAAEERWRDLAALLEERMHGQRETGDTEAYRRTASRLAALLAERLADGDRAMDILGQLLEVDPAYVPAMLALASVQEARGDDAAMQATLQQAAELGPEGEIGASLQLRLARLSDEPEVQRDHLEKALQLDPSNGDAQKGLLELSRREGNWEQVAYLLELAIDQAEDEGKRRELVLARVDVLTEKLGNCEAALALLATLYDRVQDDVALNRRIADALYGAERYEEAAGMYNWLIEVGRRAKRRNKALGHDLTRLASVMLRNGGAGEARNLLLEAYRIDTTNVETLMALGTLHEKDAEWREALKVYRTMLLQNADRSGLLRRGDLYASLARAHLALDEKPKALAMLRRGIEEDREHPELATTLRQVEGA